VAPPVGGRCRPATPDLAVQFGRHTFGADQVPPDGVAARAPELAPCHGLGLAQVHRMLTEGIGFRRQSRPSQVFQQWL